MHRMAAGRNHTTPVSLAAATGAAPSSGGRIRISSSTPGSVLGGEKPSSGLGGSDRDHGGVGGGGGGGSRDYEIFDRDRERSRSEGYSSRDALRDRGISSASRDGARDVAGRDPGRDVGRDAGRDAGRDSGRDSLRDTGRDAGRDAARDIGRDAGRETGRDAGGRETGRDTGGRDGGRDFGRDHRSRNLTRDNLLARDALSARDSSRGEGARDSVSTRDSSRGEGARDSVSTRDSSRGEGAGGGYGKERDRGNDRNIRDWEPSSDRGREKMDRERERDKRERDLSSSWHQQQRRHVGGGEGAEGGGAGDRALSPLFGRPSSAGSGGSSVRPTIIRNSVSPVGDGLADKDASNLGETRSSGGARLSSGKELEREPGELPISGGRVEEISWRADNSGPMSSMHSRNARSSSKPSLVVEQDGGEGAKRSSPTKKRKFSPIVWDYDEKQARPSGHKVSNSVTATSSSSAVALSVSKIVGSQTPQGPLVQASVSLQVLSSLTVANENVSPPSRPPSSDRASPPGLLGAQGERSLSISPQDSLSSPLSDQNRVSPLIEETLNEKDTPDIQMRDQLMASPFSDDEAEPGQLLPEPVDDSPPPPSRESPIRTEEDDEENAAPHITIAASRWAGETNTPGREKSPRGGGGKARKRSSSLESEEGRISSGHDGGHVTSGRSTSPEPGEYIQEKADAAARAKERGIDSDGSVGRTSDGKGRRSQSIEDEEYERELNKRELMELDEEESDVDDQEEQRPEVDPEFDGAPPTASGPIMRAIDMLQGCRSVDEFERLNRIDEGTYGVVYRARNKKTGEIVALKKVKMEKEKEGFPLTSLREINVLLSFHHPSVVDVKEVVVGSTIDSIFMVMEYMEHDLKGLMETMKQPFSQSEVKCLMLQLFEGVKYLHDNWVLHRDLKTSNLLMNNRGELKICDFGLARQYGSPLKPYTHMVVTLWYRAPELLLGSKTYQYSTAIDMWSLGCIMAEFLAKEPLFNGKSEIDQIDKIFKTLGTPNEKIWPEFVKLPGVNCSFVRQPYNRLREKFPPTAFAGRPTLSESGFDLLNRLLTYDPRKRITAEEALKHDWFREVPLPKSKEFMPTFPARSEHDRRVRRLMKSPDPLEEQRKRELRQGELGGGGLFG